MHPQLLEIESELQSNSDWVSRLADWASDEEWGTRPSADAWSASECVEHLNATSRAMVPLIVERLRESTPSAAPVRYRFSLLGWVVWRAVSPPARKKFKTSTPFVPSHVRSRKEDLVSWAVRQAGVLGAVDAADGHPLSRLTIASPFDPRVRYNVYSAFRILAAHQRRHLDQAEKAIGLVRGLH
jgi:hypothetical protein